MAVTNPAANWFLKVGNQVYGPMSPAELRQKAAAGLIGPETPIRKGADGHWVRAENVRGLFPVTDSQPATAGSQRQSQSLPTPPPLQAAQIRTTDTSTGVGEIQSRKPKAIPYGIVFAWGWTLLIGYALFFANSLNHYGSAGLYPVNLPILAAGLLFPVAFLVAPTVNIIKTEWRGNWSLAAKLLVVAIVTIIVVRIGRECRPPVPLPELLAQAMPNAENVVDFSAPKGLVSHWVPLIALVVTVSWLCFGHRARIVMAEKHCSECKTNTIHERTGADHILLFLIFVTTAAEAFLPPVPPSEYYVLLFWMYVSIAFVWLPFWILASVKVGGWQCRACQQKQRTVFSVGTKLAIGIYIVFMVVVIAVYEQIRDKQMQSAREEANQAIGRIEDHFSKMVEPGSHQSAAVVGANSRDENGAKPQGLIGDVEQFAMAAMNSGNEMGNDYRREIKRIFGSGLFDATRLWNDKGLTQSRAMLSKAREVVQQYRPRYASLVQSLRAKINSMGLDLVTKRQILAQFDAGAVRGEHTWDRLLDLEEKCLNEFGGMLDLLDSKSGTWRVSDGRILFQNDKDAEKYNAFLSHVRRYFEEETRIQKENAEDVKADLLRMRRGL